MAEPPPEPATPEPATPELKPLEVKPIEVNSARIVFVGIGLWTIGFLVLLPFYTELGRHHHRIWLWTCLAGIGVGLFGYAVVRRQRAAGRTK